MLISSLKSLISNTKLQEKQKCKFLVVSAIIITAAVTREQLFASTKGDTRLLSGGYGAFLQQLHHALCR